MCKFAQNKYQMYYVCMYVSKHLTHWPPPHFSTPTPRKYVKKLENLRFNLKHVYIFFILFSTGGIAQKFFGGMPTSLMQRKQEINNDNSHKTVKSRLTFISAFRIMVTVTLMKTAVAKNLSQSIIICVEHQNFSKSIRQPCCPIFWGCPGFHYAAPLYTSKSHVFTVLPIRRNKGPLAFQLWCNLVDFKTWNHTQFWLQQTHSATRA